MFWLEGKYNLNLYANIINYKYSSIYIRMYILFKLMKFLFFFKKKLFFLRNNQL